MGAGGDMFIWPRVNFQMIQFQLVAPVIEPLLWVNICTCDIHWLAQTGLDKILQSLRMLYDSSPVLCTASSPARMLEVRRKEPYWGIRSLCFLCYPRPMHVPQVKGYAERGCPFPSRCRTCSCIGPYLCRSVGSFPDSYAGTFAAASCFSYMWDTNYSW